MKAHDISISILSITSPGTFLSPGKSEDAVQITRETNEELSSIFASHPDNFRFFASLPLPSIEESLREIDHALDVLGAVGFALMSNAHGIYLGDPSLDPVMAKLNERNAIVFLHPTSCNLVISDPSTGSSKVEVVNVLPYPRPTMEFMFDETRTVANLLLSGSLTKFPNIRFIMSHCGCTLPPIIDRIGAFDAIVHGRDDNSQNFKALLQERFFFDLAGVPFPDQIFGLVRMLGGKEKARSRLLFGSDFPFTPGEAVKGLVARMEGGFECTEEGVFGLDGESVKEEAWEGNARKLFNFKKRAVV